MITLRALDCNLAPEKEQTECTPERWSKTLPMGGGDYEDGENVGEECGTETPEKTGGEYVGRRRKCVKWRTPMPSRGLQATEG